MDIQNATELVYGIPPREEEGPQEEESPGNERDYESSPQTDSEKLDEILFLLRPLAPALRALPEVVEQVGPIIDGIKKSPVLKALGVRLPS